jgi:hypothetical protein
MRREKNAASYSKKLEVQLPARVFGIEPLENPTAMS